MPTDAESTKRETSEPPLQISSSSSSLSSPSSPPSRLSLWARSTAGQSVLLVFLVADIAASTLLQRYTLVIAGSVFLPAAAVFLAEAQKLGIALAVSVYWEHGGSWPAFVGTIGTELRENRMETMLMAVPSVVYAIQNNLGYIALANLDPATYQVTVQLKIVTTALLMTVMLGTRLTRRKWFAIFLLTVGVITVNLENVVTNRDRKAESPPAHVDYVAGLSSVLAYCFCSAFASVYFERLLKQPSSGGKTSLWIKNIQIYAFGSVVSALILLVRNWGEIVDKGILNGFDLPVHVNVLLHSLGGVLISLVMNYTDNIVRNFANGAAILVSTAGAVLFFQTQIGALFFVGTGVVCASAFLYKY